MLKSGLFSVVFKVEGVKFREEYNLLYRTEEDYVKNSTLYQQATNAVSKDLKVVRHKVDIINIMRIHNDLILKHKRKFIEDRGWDNEIPGKDYFDNLFRVSENQVIFGGNYFVQYLKPTMGWIFWDKGQNLTMSDGELAYTSFDRALRRIIINRVELLKQKTFHPTEKPIKLYEWVLLHYAQPGQKILDTHGGSMSHAIAAHKLGFDLTIIEKDPVYYEQAKKRLIEFQRQQVLF